MTALAIPERALTIQQPWASLIMSGNKLIENRSWSTNWRGTFVVHAGQKTDARGTAAAAELGIEYDEPLPRGYLGLVDLVDVHYAGDECCGSWAFPESYHWRLENPRPFDKPIKGRGRLGLSAVPSLVLDAILDREPEFVGVDDMLDTGISLRQLDYWARKGYLRPLQSAPGSGVPREWPAVEKRVAQLIKRLTEAGLSVDIAAASARRAIEHNLAEITLGDGVTLSLREVV